MPRFLQGLMLSAEAAGELPEGTILSFDKSLLVNIGIQWLNIILLTVVLVFILYKPVKKFLQGRTERIKAEIDAARKEREEAMELKEQYEQMISSIEKEREEILRQAHKKAVEKSDQMLFDARHEADAMYGRALSELELERKNVMNEMREQMIEISTLMAGRFVEVSIDRATQDRLIDEAFADWEGS